MMLADAAFHEAIDRLAGNDLAMSLLRGTMPLVQSMRLRVGIIPDRVPEMLREHADIVAALRDGDGRLAAQRIRLHTNGARQAMLRALKALAPRPRGRPKDVPGVQGA
jgi:DNA-binding GntR family transcriptional regulator